METKNKYEVNWKLLASYFSGNASETEKTEVNDWLNESETNKEVFLSIEKVWDKTKNADLANIDIDAAWKKVNSQSHILRNNRTGFLLNRPYQYVFRVAAVMVIGIISWYLLSNTANNKSFNSGSKVTALYLSDGSVVTLNKETKIKYPKIFKGNSREIFLDGEAFFSIAKNPKKPFIIKTDATQIEVLGTSFDVNCHSGNVQVIVNTGIVSFKSSNGQNVILKKEDKGLFDKTTGQISSSINTDPNYVSWKTKKFIFRETRLKDVFEELEKVYNVKIIAENPVIYNCKLNSTYDQLSIDAIIHSIEKAYGYKSSKNNDNVYTLIGNDCIKKQ